ncbi:MAG: glutamate--tRNA ligase family protein [Phycisphaerales bacterium]
MSVPTTDQPPHTTRLAPSPTGALHLGNARTFLLTWVLARQRGLKIILRIEDLDGPRVRPGAIDDTIDTLRWLGIDWDDGPIIQSHDLAPYRDAMRALARAALAYPSDLTRSEIEAAASAPQEGVHESAFPASLRPSVAPEGRDFDREETNWRFATPLGPVPFDDEFMGALAPDPSASVGDFVIWTKRAQPSYQLAVVVDDHRQGVTHVVRGNDLADSAARQLLLYRALRLEPEPHYLHLPLVRGSDGKRLAKRHGDTRVATYRAAGVAPERVIGLIAGWSGLPREPISSADLAASLDLRRIPRSDVTFTAEDDAWLRNRS